MTEATLRDLRVVIASPSESAGAAIQENVGRPAALDRFVDSQLAMTPTDLPQGPTGTSLPTNTGGPEGLPSGEPPGGSIVTA